MGDIQLAIVAALEDSQLKAQIAENQALVDKTADAIELNKKATKESFNEVMAMMSASYQIVSGFTQVIGGDLSQVFSSLYGIAVSAIGVYKAIAAAIAASGVGAVQAALMFSSLITALFRLDAIMTGQSELAQRVGGINTILHSISSFIGRRNF